MSKNVNCEHYKNCKKVVMPNDLNGFYSVNGVNYCTYECYEKAFHEYVQKISTK